MNTELLYKILDCIDEVNTLSEVASKLFITQSYVSQVISKAEKKYQVKLVNHKQTPISLTVAGHKLKDGLEKLLDDQSQIKQDLLPFSNANNNYIKIAIAPLWIREKSTLIVQQLLNQFPQIKLEIRNIFTSFDSKRALENHTVDIFWGAILHGHHLKSYSLYQPNAILLIPNTMKEFKDIQPKAILNDHLLDRLNDVPMVSLTDDSAFQQIINQLFVNYGIKPQKLIKVNDYFAGAELANKGLGITVTLSNTLKYVDPKNCKIVVIPNKIVNLNEAITINTTCDERVKIIAKELVKILKKTIE